MTDAFKEREKGFEAKYQIDQDLEFRIQARRDKLFGLWLAGHFGMTGDNAAAYALEVVDSNFQEPGDEDLMRKVIADIEAKKAGIDEKELRKKFKDLLTEARSQITQQ